MKAARAEDPQTVQYVQIIAAWKKVFGIGNPKSASEIVRALNGAQHSFSITCEHGKMKAETAVKFGCVVCDGPISFDVESGAQARHEIESLTVALKAVAADRSGRDIDPTRLGKWLSKHNGKIGVAVKLVGERNRHTETNEWKLVVAPVAHNSGGASRSVYENCHADKYINGVETLPAKGAGRAKRKRRLP